MRASSTIPWAALAATALADTHAFYSGFFSGSSIVYVEFDDNASTLTLSQNITINTSNGSKWIAIDGNKENIYVGTTGYFQSYSIQSNGSLSYTSEIALSSDCPNANFIAASRSSPFTVFGTPYSSGCPTIAITVDDNGSLSTVAANLTYDSSAGVHGTDLGPNDAHLYSADDMGNAVWTHSWDSSSNTAVEIQKIDAPEGSDPRHLAAHPNGRWVYVVYEASSEIAVYSRDTSTGLLTDTNTTYPLLPDTFTNSSSYWADEVMFSLPGDDGNSTSPKYLVAATRSRTTTIPGYVSVFSLDESDGGIEEQLFLLETTGSGGSANAVSPAPFSEQYFAITDSGSNFIEMWKIEDDGSSASAVAQLALFSGPANVVWV